MTYFHPILEILSHFNILKVEKTLYKHSAGISAMAMHPTGKLCFTAGKVCPHSLILCIAYPHLMGPSNSRGKLFSVSVIAHGSPDQSCDSWSWWLSQWCIDRENRNTNILEHYLYIQFYLGFYGFMDFSEGQKANNLEPGESKTSLHHQH